MKKLILLVRRKAGTDRSAFKRHYEAIHAPLAESLMQRCTKYVRNFVDEELSGPVDFDVVTEFWFDIDGPWAEAHQSLTDAAARHTLEEDELLFMDRGSMRVFTVDEYSSADSALQGNRPTAA